MKNGCGRLVYVDWLTGGESSFGGRSVCIGDVCSVVIWRCSGTFYRNGSVGISGDDVRIGFEISVRIWNTAQSMLWCTERMLTKCKRQHIWLWTSTCMKKENNEGSIWNLKRDAQLETECHGCRVEEDVDDVNRWLSGRFVSRRFPKRSDGN